MEFEVYVFKEETYINETDPHGWLNVLVEGIDKSVSLPKYLSIKIIGKKDNRIQFRILEGFYENKLASVKAPSSTDDYFKTGILERFPIDMTYSISKKAFYLNGKEYKATENPQNRLQSGEFDILIADMPHSGGSNYFEHSVFASTWFRIMDGDEKYIHIGRVSLGCLTITNTDKWNEIYPLLILARKGDGRHIGTLKVID